MSEEPLTAFDFEVLSENLSEEESESAIMTWNVTNFESNKVSV